MASGANEEITWFEPFSDKESKNTESPGLIRRLLKRPQRATVQIDERNRSVKFQKSVDKRPTSDYSSASKVESDSVDSMVYSSPPRTLSTVIDRLDNLGRSKGSDSVLTEEDLKKYWMPDSACKECFNCSLKFTISRRKHHCRICGQIFCNTCCCQMIDGKMLRIEGLLRVCSLCLRTVSTAVPSPRHHSNPSTSMLTNQLERSGDDFMNNSIRVELPQADSPVNRRMSMRSFVSWETGVNPQSSAAGLVEGSPKHNSAGFYEAEEEQLLAIDKDAIKFGAHEIWLQLMDPVSGLKLQNHRYRLLRYPNTLTAAEIIDWLIKNGHASSRVVGVRLGQTLVDTKRLAVVNAEQVFRDEGHLLLEVGPLGSYELQGEDVHYLTTRQEGDAVVVSKEVPSNDDYGTGNLAMIMASDDDYEHDVKGSNATKDDQHQPTSPSASQLSDNDSSVVGDKNSQFSVIEQNDIYQCIFAYTSEICSEGQHYSSLEGENTPTTFTTASSAVELCNRLDKSCKKHVGNILRQLLSRSGLSCSWYDVIQPLVMEAGHSVKPNVVKGDSMDICDYVRIKKIPGGCAENSSLIYGVVCSKNVTNKRMKISFRRPRILLLTCSVELERSESKLSSFDQLRRQEYEYLKNLVARIFNHRPDIILVQGSVAKIAQDMLFDLGITLVINVKASVMKRVSRLTQGDLLTSVDRLSFPIELGTCGQFYLKGFYLPQGGKKTLMCFDQCDERLGCCVIFQGASSRELRKVKAVFRFALVAAYNACVETEYLNSSFAALPTLSTADDVCSLPEYQRSHSPDSSLYPCVNWPKVIEDVPDVHSCAATLEESIEVTYARQLPATCTPSKAANSEPVEETCPTFASVLSVQILSISSHVKFPAPYLMSTAAAVGQYLPTNMYWSNLFKPLQVEDSVDSFPEKSFNDGAYTPLQQQLITSINPWQKPVVADDDNYPEARNYISAASHPFTTCPLLFSRNSKEMKTILADYRARAGQPNSDKFFFKLAQTASILDNQLVHMAGVTENGSKKIKLDIPNKTDQIPSVQRSQNQFQRYTGDSLQFSLSEDKMAATATATDVDRTSWVESDTPAKGDVKSEKRKKNYVDCLLIENHQSISFLYWNTSRQAVQPGRCYSCMVPMHITLPYYVANDLSLGEFLEQMCYKAVACTSCHLDVFSHQSHFVHYSSCLRMNVFKLPSCIPGANNIVYNWYQCKKCQQHTPHMELTSDALSYSFAKFLELKFYDSTYVPRYTESSQLLCQHSLNQMHIQCFCQNDTVAVFDLVPITLLEVVLPPKKMTMLKHNSQEHNDWSEDIKFVSRVVEGVFHRIKERLIEYGKDPSLSDVKDDYTVKLKEDHEEYHSKLKHLRELAVLGGFFPSSLLLQDHLTDSENYEVLIKLQDAMFMLKRSLMGTVGVWNKQLEILHDFIHNPPHSVRSSKPNSSRSSPVNLETSDRAEAVEVESSQEGVAKFSKSSLVGTSYSSKHPVNRSHDSFLPEVTSSQNEDDDNRSTSTNTTITAVCSTRGHKRCQSNTVDYSNLTRSSLGVIGHRKSKSFDAKMLMHQQTLNLKSEPPSGTENDKSLEHVREHDHAEEEQQQEEDYLTTSDFIHDEVDFTSMFGKWKGKENDDPSDFYLIPRGQDGTVQAASKQHTMKLLRVGSTNSLGTDSKKRAARQSKLLGSAVDGDVPVRLLDRVNVFSKPVRFPPLPPPFKLSEHHTLRGHLKIPIAVYEKEPSSVIAFTLSSREYARQLTKRQSVLFDGIKRMSTAGKKSEELVLSPLAEVTAAVSSVASGGNVLDVDPADTAVPPTWNTTGYPDLICTLQKEHITLEFSDHAAKFSCKVYFAEEFRQLRQVVFPYGEERFIRSLARCVKWQAKGGKSGSSFCKVVDDRFILKQMKKAEVESFVEIADEYFNHLRKAFDQKMPTALAKIVGVYRISLHNSQTNDSMDGDFLVIENLLYGHKCCKVFDLKGSMSSRYIQPGKASIGESEVYLDENFLEYITVSPVYLRSYSGSVLLKAIQADTEFLSRNNVMDYSMLTGIDENNRELVLGIIDFVRAFTWDKLLEMWIKKYVGRGGRLPTVVSPELYRKRFREAMEKYFYQVPDKWTGMAHKD